MPSHEKLGNVVVILRAQSEAFYGGPASSARHAHSAQPVAPIYSDKLAQGAALGKASGSRRGVAARHLRREAHQNPRLWQQL